MNRQLIASAFILFSILSVTACAGAGRPELTDQEISVTLEPASHLLQGESALTFGSREEQAVALSLHPEAVVAEVRVGDKEVPVRFTGGVLQVGLPATHGGSVRVFIRYRCAFNDPLPERIASTEDPSYGVDAVIGEQGVFLGGNAGWYPVPATVPVRRTLKVTAPAAMEAITAGKRLRRHTTTERTVSVWEESHPVEQLSLSAGRYLVTGEEAGAIPLYAYFSPGNSSLAPSYLAASAEYLDLYQRLLGPYPFEKFAVVENFLPTGYGFPSYTLLGGTVIRLPFIVSTSLPHEIVHNWWGNGVLVDFDQGNWSEGLTTYLADYYLEERKSAAAARDYRYRILTDYAALVPPAGDFPLARFIGRTDAASRAIGYGKGAMLFHMIRTMIGDKAFFAALRELNRERLYRKASWDDFTGAFSRAWGRDLAPFVDQWLRRTGGPRLALTDVAVRREQTKWLLTGRITQTSPLWAVPVTVQVETSAGSLRQTVDVAGPATPISFLLPQEHGTVTLDPDADLFRLLSPADIPPAVNRIKGSRNLLAVMTTGCAAGRDTMALLLESLGQPGVRIARENEVTLLDITSHDLLVCGTPERRDLLPTLSSRVTTEKTGFAVEGQKYLSADDTLFAMAQHPAVPDRAAALFLPGSPAAAAACAAKITHYGKYGYLAFTGAQNRVKGIMPATGKETAVEF